MAPRRRPAAAPLVVAPKAKARGRVKAKAKPRIRPARTTPPPEDPAGWRSIQEWAPVIGQQLHVRGTYQGDPSECIGQVEGFVTDREGEWVKMKLTG